MINKRPQKHGLYNPANEHDACGVGFVAHLHGKTSRQIIDSGLQLLANLTHRGAVGANPTTGDGAGLMTQMPHDFFRTVAAQNGFSLPNQYGCAMLFLPKPEKQQAAMRQMIDNILAQENLPLLGWRQVPVCREAINDEVAASEPSIWQVFVGGAPHDDEDNNGDGYERRMFIARKQMENAARAAKLDFYCCSFSARTVVYKGMFLADQLPQYYLDLQDSDFVSAFAFVHQRFSTNTFPAWELAHPYRFIAHNGEINTLRGNINNMTARTGRLHSSVFGDDAEKITPLIIPGQSDTASLDNAVELLCLAGYSPAHALATLIPEAWQGDKNMTAARRDFYAYHAPFMEPWDGPAEVVFSNGRQIAAILDRNGLRPGRYWLTDDDLIVMASEAGVLDIPDERIRHKWFIEPGKMLLVDMEKGRVIDDGEIKQELAEAQPYGEWRQRSQVPLDSLPCKNEDNIQDLSATELLRAQQRFAYTDEDLKFLLRPMATDGAEPVGAMGDDSPTAVLSTRMKPLSAYFRQEFAQVTNPAIDPIREEIVMSLKSYLGPRPNVLRPLSEPHTTCIVLEHPILTPSEFCRLRDGQDQRCKTVVLDITWRAAAGESGMKPALHNLREAALQAVRDEKATVLILSDRAADAEHVAIPIYLAVSAVHHYLVQAGQRLRVGLVAETALAREVHDFAVLAGYGAEAIYPWLALASVSALSPGEESMENYRRAVGKGLLKTMSKMGVSTFQSYCGAQIFEAVGLATDFVDEYFCGTESQIGGIGVDEVARETLFWHQLANDGEQSLLYENALDAGGDYAYRLRGEAHLWTPASVAALQHAVRGNAANQYEEYSRLINEQSERLMTLRGMLEMQMADSPVPLEEVESAADIVRRFSTGAMSFGSISREAHTTLAIAMNRIGGKSNTGEGGEESDRFVPLANGDSMRSAIKQVASGRFGVTAEYLANADMMQIKIAQGAKPGEGGQLPGHKVDSAIARVRHSVPGVGLISPPPHHDIYSIEDIAQLIYDLKCANPNGLVSVKLVSRYGVGTVAAGVAKAKSDHITIAGHDGGTGASPLSSIKHTGTPWELGLAETHQTLTLNDLRGRIALQVDGQIKTGRDVIIGALLGADEFGFATAPLVAQGCIMMRKCHLNTCPVGIATQDERLRRKFAGKPEHVVNYFFFVAEEVRTLLAALGYRQLDDIIGRVDLLRQRPAKHWKSKAVDLSAVLATPQAPSTFARRHCQQQNHHLENAIDQRWLPRCESVIADGKGRVEITDVINNTERTAGAIVSNAIAKQHGHHGLPPDSIHLQLRGVAGQSFGAFASRGMTMRLEGEGNDYFGKGLSGGVLAVYPPPSARLDGENAIVGNTALYGAVAGECYCRGAAGARFAVRNSGAAAVIEGTGDHCCEYMTGGTVLCLGQVGRNFAAGMSGGVAFVFDESGDFARLCNTDMVALLPLDGVAGPEQHLGMADTDIVRGMLERHWQHTNSPKAKSILARWEAVRRQFVKVLPFEYQRALGELARAKKVA